MRKVVAIALFLLSLNAVLAQSDKGLLVGRVMSETGRALVGVKLFVTGTQDSGVTDVEGKFSFSVAVGARKVFVEAEGHDLLEDSIFIESGKEFYLNPVLSKTTRMEGAEIVKKKKAKENTVAAAIQTKQLSQGMVEAISAEDFAKTTIRTTSDAIKRIPGATISEGKFANIRGMFDRYNAGYLNGAPLPSTESDRKAFSFDVIPAALLDNIVVVKSATPDMIGDFGGGIIQINTKSVPEKFIQTASIGFQYNSITTFQQMDAFALEGSEFLGLPSAKRTIPVLDAAMGYEPHTTAKNPELNARETLKFNNDWSLKQMNVMPAPRFSYSLGKPFKLGKKEAGLLVSWNYAISPKRSAGTVVSKDYSTNYTYKEFNDDILTTNVQNGGVVNFSVKLNKKNRIDFRNLLSLTYDAGSTLRSGLTDADNNMFGEGFSNQVNFNRLISSQVNGLHSFGKDKSKLAWVINYGNTYRAVPDFRIANYAIPDNDLANRQLVLNAFFNAGTGRFFSYMNETNMSASADYSYNIAKGKTNHQLKTGLFMQNRNRDFQSRQFVYAPVGSYRPSLLLPQQDLGASSINAKDLYLIEKTAVDKDLYEGKSALAAAYAMVENQLPLFKTGRKVNYLKLIYGMRVERFTQSLNNDYFRQAGKVMSDLGVNVDWLPSLNIIAPLTERSNLRAAYYRTVNRPELREMAPFAFYNFSINSEILGNTGLKRAFINNADIRWEVFTNKLDMISIGVFHKEILNPIEINLDVSQALIRTFTYGNESRATNVGTEVEVRKNLGSLSRGTKWLRDLTLYGNFALIRSAVSFTDASSSVADRPLQGQSPYVVNVSLFYEHEGWQINTSFNKIGQRIAYIGVSQAIQPFGADIYEFGRSIWDVQFGKEMGKDGKFGTIKLTLGDLLAQNTVFFQDLNGNGRYDAKAWTDKDKDGDNTLFSFTNGKQATISYTFKF
ncbi:MAG: TonB-dependent receptor plug domain-containing protein [Bacteroidota bacterium]|jgi:hypothetical protein